MKLVGQRSIDFEKHENLTSNEIMRLIIHGRLEQCIKTENYVDESNNINAEEEFQDFYLYKVFFFL